MIFRHPSRDFDEAVAAVCHGSVSEEQARALNILLKSDVSARKEYLLRVEIHARLASEPDLFDVAESEALPQRLVSLDSRSRAWNRRRAGALALAASLALAAVVWWGTRFFDSEVKPGTTSKAVAMLNRTVDAEWTPRADAPRVGAPLEPGWLRLEAGLAQVVFYSGARVAIQGPAEIELISPGEAHCRGGRLTAEVPPQARGFQVRTPQATVVDLRTTFGLEVTNRRTELHVFKGSVALKPIAGRAGQELSGGTGAVIEDARPARRIVADSGAFASLFELQAKSIAAETLRFDQWREASERLHHDPSLLVHLDFEDGSASDWRLRNMSNDSLVPDATVVGCQWTSGRWPDKRAIEFQSVNDRVRLSVPGAHESLTLAGWVRVHGLDRQINSLFMCDGFAPGTVHWLIRNDGVLGLTVIGPGTGKYQIVATPPVLTLDKFGMWLHLAVVLDGGAGRVEHFVNGQSVDSKPLRIRPPYLIDEAELGNWNNRGFPGDNPFHIRNFSGAMDEFCLFGRALGGEEIRALYDDGKPQPDAAVRDRIDL